jgi:hypothetical protein
MFKGNNEPIDSNGKRVLEGDVHQRKDLILERQNEYGVMLF